MISQELMIGDWVYVAHQHSNMEGDYDLEFIAEKLTLEHFKFWADNNWDNSDFDEFLEPIPLTPEMLDRNGFTNTGDGTYTKMFESEHYIIYVGFKYRTIEAFMSFGRTKSNQVRLDNCGMYLHELQHALRLCGIEKEIEP